MAEKKLTGKRAEPTIEELVFIHSRLARLSDKEILYDMQEESTFPVRGLGFIKRRRKEFDVAKKVLREEIERKIDPIAIKSKEVHFEDLAKVAEDIPGGLGEVRRMSKNTYRCYGIQDDGKFKYVHRQELIDKLESRMVALKRQNPPLFRGFEEHMTAENADYDNYIDDMENKLVELIELLQVVALRKTFEGKCEVCKDLA